MTRKTSYIQQRPRYGHMPRQKSEQVQYEFGGPVGSAFVMVSLPLVVYGLYFACNADYCLSDGASLANALTHISASLRTTTLWSWEAAAAVAGWFALQAMLYLQLPGPMVHGVPLKDGKQLAYPMNGHLAFWISLAVASFGWPVLSPDGSLIALSPLPLAWC